jgi:predicted GNAT family acetyltransferase
MTEQSMSIQDNADHSRFEALAESGEVAGFAAYERSGDRLVFTHTVVSDDFEGRGVGSALARAGLDAARDAGLGVVPRCPFIRAYVERHPEYADLVA